MSIILEFVIANLRALRRCSLNFWINIIIALFKQILFLLSWKTFFDCYDKIGDWNYCDMLCMYGLISISIGIVEIFFGGVKELSSMIEFEKLETLILYPNHPIINIGISSSSLSSLGDIVVGIYCIYASNLCIENFMIIIFLIPLNIIFMLSLHTYINSLGFFLKNSSLFLRDLNSKVMIYLTQPASGYKGILKVIGFTIIPVTLGNYMPIKFLKVPTMYNGSILIAAVVMFFLFSLSFFNYGLKKFKSNN